MQIGAKQNIPEMFRPAKMSAALFTSGQIRCCPNVKHFNPMW